MLLTLQKIFTDKLLNVLDDVDFYGLMWKHQYEFLDILIEKGKCANYPVDVKTKSGQQTIRDLIRDAADELHEARLTLKNSKSHMSSESDTFDKDHFTEEIVDCVKFCLGALIFAGVTQKEFMKAFLQKSIINKERQNSGY